MYIGVVDTKPVHTLVARAKAEMQDLALLSYNLQRMARIVTGNRTLLIDEIGAALSQ